MEPRHVIRRIRERSDRGATFVEYALLGGLLALASLASLQFLIDTTEQGFERSLNDVGTPIEVAAPAPGDPGGGTPDPTTPGPGPVDPGPGDPGPGDPGPGEPGPGDPGPGDPCPSDPPPAPPAQPGNPDSGSRWNESSMSSKANPERCVRYVLFWCAEREPATVDVEAQLLVQQQDGSNVRNGSTAHVRIERFENGQWTSHTTIEVEVRNGRISVDVKGIPETSQVRLRLTNVTGSRNGWDGQQSYVDFQI